MVFQKGFRTWHSCILWLRRVVMKKLTALGVLPVTFLKRRYFRFQRLLKNYGKVLELLADASEKQGGGFVLDKQYLVALTNRLFDLADSIVYDLNVLTKQHHITFFDPLDRFKKEIKEILSGRSPFFPTEQGISFNDTREVVPGQSNRKNISKILKQHRVLYEGSGKVLCRGVAWGPVFLVHNPGDLRKIPERAVVVVPKLLPGEKPIPAFQNAVAILTEAGRPTGSMVSFARHFRIPFIAGFEDATKYLSPGTLITVDADENVVYEGKIEELVSYHLVEGLGYEDEPEYQMFQIIQDKIGSLNRISVTPGETTSTDCQTLHDLIHLAYEGALTALINDDLYGKAVARISKRLEIKDNLVFQVIDLGDGLKSGKISSSVIDIRAVQSRPMVILGEAFRAYDSIFGDITERMGAGSFPVTDSRPSNEKNTAVLSKEYVHLLLGRESEMDMIDAYLCEEAESNYIFCRFPKVRDENHSSLLAYEIMYRFEFEIEDTSKATHAWISRLSAQATEERLRVIACLMIFARSFDRGGYGDLSPEEVTKLFLQRCNVGNTI